MDHPCWPWAGPSEADSLVLRGGEKHSRRQRNGHFRLGPLLSMSHNWLNLLNPPGNNINHQLQDNTSQANLTVGGNWVTQVWCKPPNWIYLQAQTQVTAISCNRCIATLNLTCFSGFSVNSSWSFQGWKGEKLPHRQLLCLPPSIFSQPLPEQNPFRIVCPL